MNKALYLIIIGLIIFLDSEHITASSVNLTVYVEQSARTFSNLAYDSLSNNHSSKLNSNIAFPINEQISLFNNINIPEAFFSNQGNAFDLSITGEAPKQYYILPNAGDFSKYYLLELDVAENLINTTIEQVDHLTKSILLIPAVIWLLAASLIGFMAFPHKRRTMQAAQNYYVRHKYIGSAPV